MQSTQLDVWILDPFQIKTLTRGIKPPTLLPTTHGIRMTYFSVNKDTDNSGGLLAAVVASSLSSGLRSQISSVATSYSPTDHIRQAETGMLKERLKAFSIRSNLTTIKENVSQLSHN